MKTEQEIKEYLVNRIKSANELLDQPNLSKRSFQYLVPHKNEASYALAFMGYQPDGSILEEIK